MKPYFLEFKTHLWSEFFNHLTQRPYWIRINLSDPYLRLRIDRLSITCPTHNWTTATEPLADDSPHRTTTPLHHNPLTITPSYCYLA